MQLCYNYWEKLVTTLNKCILAEEVYTKIDVPKLAQFAQILAQKAKQLQSWTFEHKCGAIKIELDDQEADESKTTDLKKKINEFSKKNFSFIPMVSVLRRLLKKINKDTEKKQMEILEEKLANTESEANFQSQEMAKEDSSQNLRKKPESKGVSVML